MSEKEICRCIVRWRFRECERILREEWRWIVTEKEWERMTRKRDESERAKREWEREDRTFQRLKALSLKHNSAQAGQAVTLLAAAASTSCLSLLHGFSKRRRRWRRWRRFNGRHRQDTFLNERQLSIFRNADERKSFQNFHFVSLETSRFERFSKIRPRPILLS